jgi:hypothetical protein
MAVEEYFEDFSEINLTLGKLRRMFETTQISTRSLIG